MNRILESLLEGGMRVRKASLKGDEGRVLLELIEDIYVWERKTENHVKEDHWDAIAQYYLLTVNDEPMGCVRFVDPGAFLHAPQDLPRRCGRLAFPMEEFFPLDAHISDPAAVVEPTRFILRPALRNQSAFFALAGTVFLYGLRKQKLGVCFALDHLAGPLLKMGWDRMGEPIWVERFSTYGHPLAAKTAVVADRYRLLFLEMERAGLIQI